MITAYCRGHKIIWNKGNWFFADTKEPFKEPFKDKRPCKKCGKMPTKEGYDACLGYIPGVSAACCGHGVKNGYKKYTLKQLE